MFTCSALALHSQLLFKRLTAAAGCRTTPWVSDKQNWVHPPSQGTRGSGEGTRRQHSLLPTDVSHLHNAVGVTSADEQGRCFSMMSSFQSPKGRTDSFPPKSVELPSNDGCLQSLIHFPCQQQRPQQTEHGSCALPVSQPQEDFTRAALPGSLTGSALPSEKPG